MPIQQDREPNTSQGGGRRGGGRAHICSSNVQCVVPLARSPCLPVPTLHNQHAHTQRARPPAQPRSYRTARMRRCAAGCSAWTRAAPAAAAARPAARCRPVIGGVTIGEGGRHTRSPPTHPQLPHTPQRARLSPRRGNPHTHIMCFRCPPTRKPTQTPSRTTTSTAPPHLPSTTSLTNHECNPPPISGMGTIVACHSVVKHRPRSPPRSIALGLV